MRKRWRRWCVDLPHELYEKLAQLLVYVTDYLQMSGFAGSPRALMIEVVEYIIAAALLQVQSDLRLVTGDGDNAWRLLRWHVLERDHFTCLMCDKTYASRGGPLVLHAHHITPRSHGGRDEVGNLATLCRNCHESIHDQGKPPWPEAKKIIDAKLSSSV